MAEIGSAFVSIVPSARGFGSKLTSETSGEVDASGRSLGKTLGSGIALAGAAAFAAGSAALVASISSALDQGRLVDKFSASLGQTPKESERFGKIAGKLYADAYGDSFEDVASSVAAVQSSFGKLGGKALKDVSAQALDFSSIFDIDVPRAAGLASVAITSGLAKDATGAFDLMTAAAQKVPAALRENIFDAADEYGQFFTGIGFNGEQTFAALVKGAEQGEFGIDKIGDAVKEFTIRSTDMSKVSTDAYGAIGLDAKTMSDAILAGGKKAGGATQQIIDGLLGIKDPTKQATAAIGLFGTPLEDLGVKNIPEVLRSLQDGGKGLGNFGGSIKRAGDTLNDNASTGFTAFKRGIQQTFVGLATTLLPTLERFSGFLSGTVAPAVSGFVTGLQDGTGAGGLLADIVGKIGTVISTVVGFLNQHRTAVAGVTTAVVALVAITRIHTALLAIQAAGGLLAVIKALPIVSTLTRTYAAVQALLNAVMSANPIALVVIGIVALVAGLILAYKKSDTFRAIVDKAFSVVRNVVSNVVGFLAKYVPATFAAISGAIKAAVTTVKNFVTSGFNAVRNAIAVVGAYVRAGGAAYAEFASSVVNKVGDVVKFFRELPGKITGFLKAIPGQLVTIGGQIIDGLKRGIDNAAGRVMDAVQNIINRIPKKIRQIMGIASPSKVTTILGGYISDGLAKGITSGDKKVTKAIGKVLDKAKEKLTQRIEDFKALSSSVAENAIGDLFGGFDTATAFVDNLRSTQGGVTQLLAAFKTLRGFGLPGGFIAKLFADGGAPLILDLAANKDAATSAAAIFGDIQSLSGQLGDAVAQNAPDVGGGATLADLQATLQETNRLLSKVPEETGSATARGVSRTTAKGARSKKGKKK